MTPTVILIRHAQALHTHGPRLQPTMPNPLPAPTQKTSPLAQTIDLIVVSPMIRTLQTAQQSLGWLIERGVPVILRPEWQENSAKPCDTGTAIPIMEAAWPQFNWADVDPLFPKKEGLYEYSQNGLTQRGIEARRWLRERPEKCIAV
ncbi:putative phosphatase, partial [Lachnellula subtilissima]